MNPEDTFHAGLSGVPYTPTPMNPIDTIKEALTKCRDYFIENDGPIYSQYMAGASLNALTALDSLTIKVAPSPWISVSDRLPPIHEEPFLESRFVLILFQCKGWKPDTWKTMKASRTIGEWDENGDPLWFWFDEDGEIIDDDDNLITHWMEIPSPPYPTKS